MFKLRSFQSNIRGAAVTILIYMLVLVIVGVGVVLPILNNLIGTSGLSGITLTIVSFVGTIIAVAILYHVSSVF